MEKVFYISGALFIFLGVILFYQGTRNIIKGFFMLWFTDWKPWQIERLNICNVCTPNKDTCPECGCFKEPKVKLKDSKCPRKKWQSQ